jgi:hypothetical protein
VSRLIRFSWLAATAVALVAWSGSAAALTPRYSDSGKVVHWRAEHLTFVLDESLESAGEGAREAAARAASTWSALGRGVPAFSTVQGSDRRPGFQEGGANENVVVFAPSGYSAAGSALGITVLTYFGDTGQIIDADVVLNGGARKFAVLDPADPDSDSDMGSDQSEASKGKHRYDVQNVLTHELGHALGLPEEQAEKRATMYAYSSAGETHKRKLHATDVSAVVQVYEEAAKQGSAPAAATGCGAELARGWADGTSRQMAAFVLLVCAAALLRLARGRRPVRQALAVSTTLAALAALLVPPAVAADRASVLAPAAAGKPDADITIVGADARWVDGIVVTRLSARIDRCHAARCPSAVPTSEVLGGRIGPYVQIVGTEEVPDVGVRLSVRLGGAKAWTEVLKPAMLR